MFDLETFKPLIGALETAGLPILSTVFSAALSPIAGPFAPLLVSAAMGLVPVINKALGIDPDAPPDTTAAAIMANPDDAQAKLAAVQEEHQYSLDTIKVANDYALQSQSQQVAINTVEAANPSMFIGGWRPALMWGLGGYLLMVVLLPYLVWLISQFGHFLSPPPEPSDLAIGILTGLLGTNIVVRGTERIKGVDSPKIGGTTTKTIVREK